MGKVVARYETEISELSSSEETTVTEELSAQLRAPATDYTLIG